MSATTSTILPAPDRRDSFELQAPPAPSWSEAARIWVLGYPQREWLLRLLRKICPILRLKSFTLVLRDEDVREVLAHNEDFPVAYAARMQQLTGDRNFLLGMPQGPEYQLNYAQLTQAFKRDDVPRYVTRMAAQASESILRGRTELDAVRQLLWKVPAQLCREYFGIAVAPNDELLLADWSVAMSSFLFGPHWIAPSPQESARAMQAAAGFRTLIRAAIQTTLNGNPTGIVLPRLIRMHLQDPQQLPLAVIEADLFGMVLGFIPTDVMASGNILDTLLREKKFMAQARAAALADDDDLLWRCLRETLRFRHINPGPFRTTGEKGYTLAAGTRRQKTIPPGTPIVASAQSAMFDSRRVKHPTRFDPNRPADNYLIFSYGQHSCLGAHIAMAQLTQTFKALLRKEGLRRVRGKQGKLRRIGLFPAQLLVEWDA